MARLRSCSFCLELYPDDFKHMICMDILCRDGYQFSAILHDKDVSEKDPNIPIKPHHHVVLVFNKQRDLHVVARELDLEERWVEPARNRVACERYLCHLDNPEKYQYDPSEIFGPLADHVRALYEGGKTEDDKVKSLLFLLDTMPVPCSYRKFVVCCCDAGLYGTLRRMGSLFKPILDEHNGFTNGT